MSNEETEKSRQAYAALGVGLVCILVGLPLWWKTTEIYRVELPYSDISHLNQTKIHSVVHFTIISLDEALTHIELTSLENKLKVKLKNKDGGNDRFSVSYHGNVRDGYEDERRAWKAAKNLDELDNNLNQLKLVKEFGKYTFVLLPDLTQLEQRGEGCVGRSRYTYLNSRTAVDQLVTAVEQLLVHVYVSEGGLKQVWSAATGAVHHQADKQSMRSVHSSAKGYDVTFTLLNPQPDLLKATWDVKEGVQRYLSPLISTLAPYAPLSISSQYLHSTGIGVRPTRSDSGDTYHLNAEQLSHIINPVEAYLGSHVSNNPSLNFIVYITHPDHAPLQLLHSDGRVVETNAFLSPRWGGFMVYNTAVNTTVLEVDMKAVLEVFSAQLRLLLGITSPPSPVPGIVVSPAGNKVLTEWELDLWLRTRCVENMANSASTLSSLAQLLDKITNIVINDDIGREVENSVAEIKKTNDLLLKGDLHQAFLTSRRAMTSAETAFFDPSLLELLYFPEDQKFAIYIPLFLPVSFPVLMSTFQAIKWFLKQRKEKQE